MNRFLLICAGGAVGTGARYLLTGWTQTVFGPSFPYGTLAVNVIGAFLIGIIMHFGLTTEILSPTARQVLATGVIGGFTTYSSFNYETLGYFQDGEILKGTTNLGVMIFACLLAGFLGLMLARKLA